MMDLGKIKQDLESKPPEVFARLHGALLIDELERHRAKTGELAGKLLEQSQRVGAAIKAFVTIKAALEAFCAATGWADADKHRPLPTTQRRWRASQLLARIVLGASRRFFSDLDAVDLVAKLTEQDQQAAAPAEPQEPETEPEDHQDDPPVVH